MYIVFELRFLKNDIYPFSCRKIYKSQSVSIDISPIDQLFLILLQLNDVFLDLIIPKLSKYSGFVVLFQSFQYDPTIQHF